MNDGEKRLLNEVFINLVKECTIYTPSLICSVQLISRKTVFFIYQLFFVCFTFYDILYSFYRNIMSDGGYISGLISAGLLGCYFL
jgi:hypothetical protein